MYKSNMVGIIEKGIVIKRYVIWNEHYSRQKNPYAQSPIGEIMFDEFYCITIFVKHNLTMSIKHNFTFFVQQCDWQKQ